MQITTVGIIGGGASGMMAAIAAARSGADVILFEKNEKLGRKLFSTGNGRCNFTNEYMEPECFRSDSPEIIPEVLRTFSFSETIDFFRGIGIFPKSRNGYLYPQPDQASAVVSALELELLRMRADFRTDCPVLKISRRKKYFLLTTKQGDFAVRKLIIAAGSRAAGKLGATEDGYQFAKQFGHSLSPVVPALVQLVAAEKYFKALAGIRIDAKATAWIDGRESASDTGEVQLTSYGLSGIPVFQISRYISKALLEGRKTEVQLDLLPELSFLQIIEELKRRIGCDPSRRSEQLLYGIFNQKLIPVLLSAADIQKDLKGKLLSDRKLKALVSKIKDFRVRIIGTKSFDEAQICAGGVILPEIDPCTMESLKCRNLYLAGELLDADGICGGYNLQWAWSTGWIAGNHAARGGRI